MPETIIPGYVDPNYLSISSYTNPILTDSPVPLIPSRYTPYYTTLTSLGPLTVSPLSPVNYLNSLDSLVGHINPFTSVVPVIGPVGATVILPGSYTLPAPLDLNKDLRVHRQVTKYFRYKTLDKWLYENMSDILDYFKVSGDNVDIVKSLSEVGKQSHSTQDIEKIIAYIEKNVLTEETMSRIIHHFVKNSQVNWYDMHKNEIFVIDIIHKKLLDILKDTVNERK